MKVPFRPENFPFRLRRCFQVAKLPSRDLRLRRLRLHQRRLRALEGRDRIADRLETGCLALQGSQK